MTARLLIRCDALPSIGFGHLGRCVALAEAWADAGGEAVLVVAGPRTAIEAFASEFELIWAGAAPPSAADDVRLFLSKAQQLKPDIAVIDSYTHAVGWESAVRSTGLPLLAIDDLASRAHDCDVLLDTSLSPADAPRYLGLLPDDATLLLGAENVLLRRAFRLRSFSPRDDAPVARVLLSFGGADPENHTGAALDAVSLLDQRGFAVDVVTSSANLHLASLRERVTAIANAQLHVDTQNMAGLMAMADLALGSVGSTAWERCRAGLPALVTITADNQRGIARRLVAENVVRLIDGDLHRLVADISSSLSAALADGKWRAQASRRAMQLVDGLGATRVVGALKNATAALHANTLSC